MNALPIVSVVLPTHNRAKVLPRCLRSLAEQAVHPDTFEVVIVDNASTDDTPAICRGFTSDGSRFRVVQEARLGRSTAVNTGVAAARGTIVAFLDDDGWVHPTWLERIVRAFDLVRPRPVMVGGPIQAVLAASPPAWFAEQWENVRLPGLARFLSREETFGICGGNSAVNRTAFLDAGGLRGDLGHRGRTLILGDDTDLALRLFDRHGRLWYDPDLIFMHEVPRSRMTVRYRLHRAFAEGLARSRIDGWTPGSPGFARAIPSALWWGFVTCFRGDRPVAQRAMLGSTLIARAFGRTRGAFGHSRMGDESRPFT